MAWKQNKLVAIAAVPIALICIAITLIPFIRRSREDRRFLKESLGWAEKHKLDETVRQRQQEQIDEIVIFAERAQEKEAIAKGEVKVEIVHNPFLTEEEVERFSDPDYREPVQMNVSAVFYTPPESKIIVDGRVLKEGDIINNKRIIKIKPEEAILKDIRGEYSLKLKGVLPESRYTVYPEGDES